MNHTVLKRALAIVGCVCVLLLLFAIFQPKIAGSLWGKTRGQMQVEVLDGENNAPIEGAVVVIPEAGVSAKTDANGKTEVLTLPVFKDARFRSVLPKTWGEVTLLVYRDGYAPYMLVNTQVFENELRDGPLVYLFKGNGKQETFSVVEGPERAWVEDMIEKYAPKQ